MSRLFIVADVIVRRDFRYLTLSSVLGGAVIQFTMGGARLEQIMPKVIL